MTGYLLPIISLGESLLNLVAETDPCINFENTLLWDIGAFFLLMVLFSIAGILGTLLINLGDWAARSIGFLNP